MTEERGQRRAAARPGLLPLAIVVPLVGWAWAPMLGLHLSGEDFTLLARLERGLEASPHVFRPLLGAWLAALHALFGATSGVPWHAATLAVHLANTALVFLLARRLLGSAWTAGACAALFGLGAGVRDALFWVAAVNRPLSACGALLALVGLAHLERPAGEGGRRAALAAVLGLAWQFGANEDVYGTALFALAWCAWVAWRTPAARARALGPACAALALLAVHFLWIRRVPGGGTPALLQQGLPLAWSSALARSTALARGLGFPAALGLALPLLGAAGLAAARERRAAAFALGAWLASFVPFALSDPVGYRFYPTQAPLALLFAGGLVTLFARAFPWPLVPPAAFAALVALALAGSRHERALGLARWQAALEEIDACEAPLRALAAAEPEHAPVSVNIETTTMGLVYYLWPSIPDPSDVVYCGFLDAASGYVPLADPPPGTWFGRRCEGSFGVIEPARYFAQRPALEPYRLYGSARRAGSLDEARALLAGRAVDLATTAVVEPPAGLEPALDALDGLDPGATLAVLEPLTTVVPNVSGRLRVRVASARAVVVAVQDNLLYHPLFRWPPDTTITSGVRGGRLFTLEAAADDGTRLPTFPLNAYGLGALVPAGTHTLELLVRRYTADELR